MPCRRRRIKPEAREQVKERESAVDGRLLHLHEVGVRALFVETPRYSREIDEGNKMADAIAGLVVQTRQAAEAMPQPQVAAVSVQDVGVEAQDGVCAIDRQHLRPRRLPR